MSIDQFLENAHRALRRNEFVLASGYMRQAEELEPDNAQVQSNMSYLAYLSGDLDQALHKGHQAVLLDPENIHARINYGNALRTQGDVQTAIEHLEFVITKDADSALAWTQLNLAYQDQQQITKAIAAGRNAIRCDPGLVHGYSNLALTLQQIGRVSEAARLLENALSIEPTVDFLHKNRLMNQQYLPQLNSRELIETAQRYGEICHGYCQTGSHQIPDDNEPIRIGILSGDFRYHPVGWFLLAVLKAFAPNKTHITLYANQQISDGMTCDLEAAADG